MKEAWAQRRGVWLLSKLPLTRRRKHPPSAKTIPLPSTARRTANWLEELRCWQQGYASCMWAQKNSVASGTMCNLTIPGSVWPAHFKASCIKRPALHAFPSKKIRPAGPHLVWGSGLWSERVKVGLENSGFRQVFET